MGTQRLARYYSISVAIRHQAASRPCRLNPLYRKALDELLQIFVAEGAANSIQPHDFG